MSNTTTEPKKWPHWKEFQELLVAGKAFFNHDGCTGVPDLTVGACCMEHDYYYTTHVVSRKEADKRFKACIRKKGFRFLDNFYYWGVRLFGRRAWTKKFDPTISIPEAILRIEGHDSAS